MFQMSKRTQHECIQGANLFLIREGIYQESWANSGNCSSQTQLHRIYLYPTKNLKTSPFFEVHSQ
jgi:hypothetical protein